MRRQNATSRGIELSKDSTNYTNVTSAISGVGCGISIAVANFRQILLTMYTLSDQQEQNMYTFYGKRG